VGDALQHPGHDPAVGAVAEGGHQQHLQQQHRQDLKATATACARPSSLR
jgi:hypothetical protein